jgi:endonuclease YncB( thermonuclease family)
VTRRRFFLALLAAAGAAGIWRRFAEEAPSPRRARRRTAKAWERLDGCTLVPHRWSDGDSFRVRHHGREHLFRLYYVDAPEAEHSLPERLHEQGRYFGITAEQAGQVGREAGAFTRTALAAKPFSIQTRWRDALGRSEQQRFYALVQSAGGDLGERLVSAGLARIHGVRVPLPDGRDSRTYLRHLRNLESAARAKELGGWGKRRA